MSTAASAAADSVFAFDLQAGQNAASFSNFLVERTQSYEAADDITVQWWGKPGYIDSTYFTNFWLPLPKAQWSTIATANLTTAPETTRTPLGWGPYILQDWVSGDHISLVKNPIFPPPGFPDL